MAQTWNIGNWHQEGEAEGQRDRNTLGLPAGIYCSIGKQSTIFLRDFICELAGDKTSKLNSHNFSLSEPFLCGRTKANLCFSLVQCHAGSGT